MSEKRLVVEGVVKEYPAPVRALRVLSGMSFELDGGESLVIMGPSGSGKSTLLNIIGTLDSPTEGTVRVDGENVHRLSESGAAEFRNRKIGFVFQDHHLLPQLTASENVVLPALAAGRVPKDIHSRAAELLYRVRLHDRAGHFPSELSGGERQRVAIARALINEPKILLCDEPTGDLDAENSESVGRLLMELRDEHGAAMVLVTHNRILAEMLGDWRTLKNGRLDE
jgi:lipoprotein-releasing system ATP-binding protein